LLKATYINAGTNKIPAAEAVPMHEIEYVSGKNIAASDQSTKDILKRGFFGTETGGKLLLTIEEALYLMDVRNVVCRHKKGEISFNELASRFSGAKKLMARYFAYREWRDRGLVIKDPSFVFQSQGKLQTKAYPSSGLRMPEYRLSGVFFSNDLTVIIDDKEKGRELYDNFWLGQYGSYKAAERGHLDKLDIYETAFLLEKGMLALTNVTQRDVIKTATSRRKEFPKLYEVYKDWREKGYVIKTGFKFGTHFRVYFPGAKPVREGTKDWAHSKHVIHVFPKESRLLISEWARAIRVAHSVRKTFILAVPGKLAEKKMRIDFVLFHRRGGEAENPENSNPKYAMLSLNEEEYIGGKEFAGAIKEARSRGLDLILAISDRETAVTYYKARQIRLSGSDSEYYEIDWFQP
jgi:tRNA-intron endonuclease